MKTKNQESSSVPEVVKPECSSYRVLPDDVIVIDDTDEEPDAPTHIKPNIDKVCFACGESSSYWENEKLGSENPEGVTYVRIPGTKTPAPEYFDYVNHKYGFKFENTPMIRIQYVSKQEMDPEELKIINQELFGIKLGNFDWEDVFHISVEKVDYDADSCVKDYFLFNIYFPDNSDKNVIVNIIALVENYWLNKFAFCKDVDKNGPKNWYRSYMYWKGYVVWELAKNEKEFK